MKTKREMKNTNKGFTLIELIVTVAIIAIFLGVILMFVTTGSNTYRSTSSTAKVQMETQETFDRIEDMIIDVNRSLYYANGSGDSIGTEIKNDIKNSGDGNSTDNKTFIVCNEYKNGNNTSQYICDVLDWDKEEETIYYSQREYKADSSEDSDTQIASFSSEDENAAVVVDDGNDGEKNVRDKKTKIERSVLATGILDFRADVSKVESDKIVRFQLSTENGTKQIETLHSISLRNKVKIKKPSDSFDSTDSTDVGIKISYAPDSMDQGSSDNLRWSLSGNGSIDPTTITWTVVDNSQNGYFPSADRTNGKLTINDDATGTITVKVSAKTTTGKTIESAPWTIKINEKNTGVTPTPVPAKPKNLQITPGAITVAAGAAYDVSTITQGLVNVIYSDGSVKTLTDGVTWSVNGSGASLANNKVNVDASANSFEMTASVTVDEQTLTGTLTVNVAKITLNTPSGTYNTGNERPQISYTYTIAGATTDLALDALTVNCSKQDSTASGYTAGSKFTNDDVGSWTMNISYDLSGNQYQYGVVAASSTFTVEKSNTGTGEIILSDDMIYDTVVPIKNNSTVTTCSFTCSLYNATQFHLRLPENSDINSAVVTWSLKDNDDTVSISPVDDGREQNATIQMSTECRHGFTLIAEYIQYKWVNGIRTEDFKFRAERTFNVMNGLSLELYNANGKQIQNNEVVTAGDKYTLKAYINSYDINGKVSKILVLPETVSGEFSGVFLENDNIVPIKVTEDKKGWTVVPVVEGKRNLIVRVQHVEESNLYNGYNYQLEMTMPLEVKLPELKADIITSEPQGKEKPIEVYLQLLDANNQPVERNVEWICYYGGNFDQKTSLSGVGNKVVFTPTITGTITIQAQYKPDGYGYVTKTVNKEIKIPSAN